MEKRIMKKKMFYRVPMYFVLLLVLAITVGCKEKDDEWHRAVSIGYGAVCSSDLMKFVKPEITYTDKDFNIKTLELSDSTWIQKIDREDVTTQEPAAITFQAELRLVRRPTMPDTVGKTFSFRYDLDAVCAAGGLFLYDDHEKSKIYPVQKVDINISNINYHCSGENIEVFLAYAEKHPSKVTITFNGVNGINKHIEKGILNFRLDY